MQGSVCVHVCVFMCVLWQVEMSWQGNEVERQKPFRQWVLPLPLSLSLSLPHLFLFPSLLFLTAKFYKFLLGLQFTGRKVFKREAEMAP